MCKIKIPKDKKKLFLIYLALFITEHKKQEKNNKRLKKQTLCLMKFANEGFVWLITSIRASVHSSFFSVDRIIQEKANREIRFRSFELERKITVNQQKIGINLLLYHINLDLFIWFSQRFAEEKKSRYEKMKLLPLMALSAQAQIDPFMSQLALLRK